MNREITRLRKKLLFLLIPTLIGTIYLGSTVLSSSPKKVYPSIKVNNLTKFCELLNVKYHQEHINYSFQNNGDKAVTAFLLTYRIDSSTVFTYKEDYAFSEGDDVILPGRSVDRVIGIPPNPTGKPEIVFNLSAVIYEDNTYEGNPHIVRDIQDNRLGQKLELIKALPVIERVSRLPETEINLYWNKNAKQDLETALNEPDTSFLTQLSKKSLINERYNQSEEFKLGIQAGKEDVLQKYQELLAIQEKQGIVALREGIHRLRNVYARMIARP